MYYYAGAINYGKKHIAIVNSLKKYPYWDFVWKCAINENIFADLSFTLYLMDNDSEKKVVDNIFSL